MIIVEDNLFLIFHWFKVVCSLVTCLYKTLLYNCDLSLFLVYVVGAQSEKVLLKKKETDVICLLIHSHLSVKFDVH